MLPLDVAGGAVANVEKFVGGRSVVDSGSVILGPDDDKKDVYAEVKFAGFDVKIIRQVARLRKEDPKDRDERSSLLDTYLHAIETATPDI
jgi:hypothetical protein